MENRDEEISLNTSNGQIYRKSELESLFNFEGSFGQEKPRRDGGVAQLGEHLLCKQGVIGSNPFISTMRVKDGKGSTSLKCMGS